MMPEEIVKKIVIILKKTFETLTKNIENFDQGKITLL